MATTVIRSSGGGEARRRAPRRRKARSALLAAAVAVGVLAGACGSDDDPTTEPAAAAPEGATDGATDPTTDADHGHAGAASGAEAELRATMRELWADHMQWTYATVGAFFHHTEAVDATLQRLLRNQADIGDAVAAFYGEEAGAQLTELLTGHIELAVPVLQAAQAGDDTALQAALEDWYANAQEVADFLSAANPDAWPESATRPALEMHIDQTTSYAVDLLQGDYAGAIEDYDIAFDHMMQLADILAAGLVEQFPDRFDT